MEYRTFIGHLNTKLERTKPKVGGPETSLHLKEEAHTKGDQLKGGDLIFCEPPEETEALILDYLWMVSVFAMIGRVWFIYLKSL